MTATWVRTPISELYEGLYDGPHATPKPSDSGPVFLGIGNVTDDGHLDLGDIRHIAEDDFSTWTRRVEPRPGDIVFTYEATLNRYAIIPDGFRGCLGRRMALIRPNPRKVDTRFLFYYFFTPAWREVIKNNMLSGATVDRIPLSTFPDFPVFAPNLRIQRRIAAALTAYDELIENNRRRMRILEDMAQALYREWFAKLRFPGHETLARDDAKLPWPERKLPACIEMNPKVLVPREGEKPFVPMQSLAEGSMLITNPQMRSGNSGAKFQNGDTLVARITPCLENGKTGFVQFMDSPESSGFGSTEFIVLRSRTLTPEYVYCLARSDEFRAMAIKSMTGASGRQRVQEKALDQFELAQPPKRLLSEFSLLVAPAFQLVQQLHLQSEALRRTRDLLLPRLMSGQLTVDTLTDLT